jgi:hypothetical protein
MNNKNFEDYETIELEQGNTSSEEIIYSSEEEISELKDILIFEEK